MRYFDDITVMRGDEAEAVDVIIGGSPCQGLSVAGQRKGFEDERSVLFLDQIRVIKEAHSKYGRNKPRYMVWENVPGALSSADGEDFRRVLEETVRVVDKAAVIPRPPKGRWTTAGAIVGDGYSVAWRVLNAQFFGVPQRRRRLTLIADLGGHTALRTLFAESESVSGEIAERGEARKATAADTESGVGETGNGVKCLTPWDCQSKRIYAQDGCMATLQAMDNGGADSSSVLITSKCQREDNGCCCLDKKPFKAYCIQGNSIDRADTAVPDPSKNQGGIAVYDARGNGDGETVPTITGDHANRVTDYTAVCCDPSRNTVRRLTPLECERLQGYPMVREVKVTEMTKDEYIAWNINEGNVIVDTEQGRIFATRGPGGAKLKEPKELLGTIANGYKVVNIRNREVKMQCRVHRMVWIAKHGVIPEGYVIDHINNDKLDNRIENLQILTAEENSHKAKKDGAYLSKENNPSAKITNEVHDLIQYVYSNAEVSIRQLAETFGISKSRVHQIIHDTGWTDIGEWTDSKGRKRKTSDTARYKALGNSIALPPWRFVCRRICEQYDTPPTMGSLFDGIGGFPLIWREINGADSVPWVCEIDEYCKAVTRRRLP